MIYSLTPRLTWIAICAIATLTETLGDARESSPSGRYEINYPCKNESRMLSGVSEVVERNRRALQEIYRTREKKESEDPMNYLSKLYDDISEQRGGPWSSIVNEVEGNAESGQGIVDPPQMELVFHRRVPNCDNEFNISKIVELVDDDKRQRQCPCACPPLPCGTMQGFVHSLSNKSSSGHSLLHNGPHSAQHFFGSTQSAPLSHSSQSVVGSSSARSLLNAQVGGLLSQESTQKNDINLSPKSPKTNVKTSGAVGAKKIDEKMKNKSNQNVLPKSATRKVANTGIVDIKKNSVPRLGNSLLAVNKNLPRQQNTNKQPHGRVADLRLKQNLAGSKTQSGKSLLSKQPLSSYQEPGEWNRRRQQESY